MRWSAVVFLAAFLFPFSVQAGVTLSAPAQARPAITPAVTIAMFYEKMVGRYPDFATWVQATPEYSAADAAGKMETLDKKSREFEETFNLLTMADPIRVEMPVRLSNYNAMQKGFIIENFAPDTFFGFSYLDQHYALVPRALTEKQWVPVPPDSADAFLSLTKEGKEALAQITMMPRYADAKEPMDIANVKHWLMLGEISEISIWSADGTRMLWQGAGDSTAAEPNKLLDLYR